MPGKPDGRQGATAFFPPALSIAAIGAPDRLRHRSVRRRLEVLELAFEVRTSVACRAKGCWAYRDAGPPSHDSRGADRQQVNVLSSSRSGRSVIWGSTHLRLLICRMANQIRRGLRQINPTGKSLWYRNRVKPDQNIFVFVSPNYAPNPSRHQGDRASSRARGGMRWRSVRRNGNRRRDEPRDGQRRADDRRFLRTVKPCRSGTVAGVKLAEAKSGPTGFD